MNVITANKSNIQVYVSVIGTKDIGNTIAEKSNGTKNDISTIAEKVNGRNIL